MRSRNVPESHGTFATGNGVLNLTQVRIVRRVVAFRKALTSPSGDPSAAKGAGRVPREDAVT